MSSLYRKYRPSKFSELIGQDHIRSSIESMIEQSQVGHAFLFSGPRGTGKTTLARLLAKSINCVGKRENAEPCESCPICLEISSNRLVDINEIDAASNRGIDEMRELKEKITFAPTMAKYKVYIIDEVHMLTKEAFNALLKTLEEPPSHVVFILATTELHKVPETIISRCQRYQFRLADKDQLRSLLKEISRKEKLKLNDAAIQFLSERAEGSYRDALTLLGNISHQGDIDESKLRELIGAPSADVINSLEQALKEKSPPKITELIKSILDDGGDLMMLVRTYANHCRKKVFEAKSDAEISFYGSMLEKLLLCIARSRQSSDATSLLSALLINLTLEGRSFQDLPETKPIDVSSESMSDLTEKEEPATQSVDTVSATPDSAPEISNDFWTNFLLEVKENNHALYAIVRSANFGGLTDDKLTISVKFRFYSERLFEPKNRLLIETAASKVAERPIRIECLVESGLEVKVNKEEDLLSAVVDVFELDEGS